MFHSSSPFATPSTLDAAGRGRAPRGRNRSRPAARVSARCGDSRAAGSDGCRPDTRTSREQVADQHHVVAGVHRRIGRVAVPQFPDGRGALAGHIAPTRVILLRGNAQGQSGRPLSEARASNAARRPIPSPTCDWDWSSIFATRCWNSRARCSAAPSRRKAAKGLTFGCHYRTVPPRLEKPLVERNVHPLRHRRDSGRHPPACRPEWLSAHQLQDRGRTGGPRSTRRGPRTGSLE